MKENKLLFIGKNRGRGKLEDAQIAMKQCCLNALAAVKGYAGDLDKIKRVVKLEHLWHPMISSMSNT